MDKNVSNLERAEGRYGDLPLEWDSIYWLLKEQAEQSKRIADALEDLVETENDHLDLLSKRSSSDEEHPYLAEYRHRKEQAEAFLKAEGSSSVE